MKRTVRKIAFLFGLVVIGASGLKAQDIHFSQFYASPLTLNPALTGVMNCTQRFVANYRNQWASVLKSAAYNTFSASYDRKIAVGQYDYFGIGGALFGDVAGTVRFGQYKGLVSLSFSKKMFGDRTSQHYLSFGANAGLGFRNIDFANARWGSQHDGNGGFNPGGQADVIEGQAENISYADISVGLLWFSVFDKNNNVYIGAAYDHLNQPNVSFVPGNNNISLDPKYTIHAGGEYLLNPKMSLLPGAVMLSQGPSFELNAGTSARFLFGPSDAQQAVQFGLWARMANRYEFTGDVNSATKSVHMDAFILSTRFDYESISLGFSYDINTSALSKASNGNGSFEFSLIYLICGAENRGVYCPTF